MTLATPIPGELDDAEAARYVGRYLADLEKVVGGADDAAIVRGLRALPGGAEGALGLVAAGIPEAFRPQYAGGETGRVLFFLETDGVDIPLCLEILPDGCRLIEPDEQAEAEIRVSLPTFLKIAFKFMDGNDAYVSGLTELKGDVFLATNLDRWFDVPTAVRGPEPADRAESL